MEENTSNCKIVRGTAHGNLPFSRYVAAGNTVYVSGIVGRDPISNELEPDNLERQTRVALSVIESILREAGASLGDVMKATIFVTDMSRYGEVNIAYRDAFGANLPARTCVEAKRLPDPEAQVEIDVIACRREG